MKIAAITLIVTCVYFIFDGLLFGVLEIFGFDAILNKLYDSSIYTFVGTLMSVVFHVALIVLAYKGVITKDS